jgi:hypothetical protein
MKNVPVSVGLKEFPLSKILPLNVPPVFMGLREILGLPLQTTQLLGLKLAFGFVKRTLILSLGKPQAAVWFNLIVTNPVSEVEEGM